MKTQYSSENPINHITLVLHASALGARLAQRS